MGSFVHSNYRKILFVFFALKIFLNPLKNVQTLDEILKKFIRAQKNEQIICIAKKKFSCRVTCCTISFSVVSHEHSGIIIMKKKTIFSPPMLGVCNFFDIFFSTCIISFIAPFSLFFELSAPTHHNFCHLLFFVSRNSARSCNQFFSPIPLRIANALLLAKSNWQQLRRRLAGKLYELIKTHVRVLCELVSGTRRHRLRAL